MFHKEEAAIAEWSPEIVARCAARQQEILECALHLLRPGGVLVYSTCTFAPAEDEDMVAWLLENYPELELSRIDTDALGISEGTIPGTGRIYPHRQRGEGHFVARLKKRGELTARRWPEELTEKPGKKEKKGGAGAKAADDWKEYEAFEKMYLSKTPAGRRLAFGDHLYLLPENLPDIRGMKTLRPGLHLGTNKKNRFEPSHALALALHSSEAVQVWETDSPLNYLRGITLSCDQALEGWTLVTWQNQPMGWGKASRGVLKNHYPKGLRITW